MARVGFLCGLEAEARALGRWRHDPRLSVAISGADTRTAELKAELLVADGAHALVSWGMAGSLNPDLAPGHLVIGSTVTPDHDPTMALVTPPDRWGRPLAGATVLVATPGAKARLRAETGADAVDMETAALARAAAPHGLPVLAVRAIADPADRALPVFLAGVLDSRGRPRPAALMAGLLGNPTALGALWRLRGDSRAALATLARFAETDLDGVLASYL